VFSWNTYLSLDMWRNWGFDSKYVNFYNIFGIYFGMHDDQLTIIVWYGSEEEIDDKKIRSLLLSRLYSLKYRTTMLLRLIKNEKDSPL
jgi:hypothetical protein